MGIDTKDFNFVREMVRVQSAIVLEPGKEYLVESRLTSLARAEGFGSLDQFLVELRARPALMQKKVVEAMTTNETSFFRDIHPFDALKTGLVPEIAKRNAVSRRIDIWCAACSSGQEPYTVAMTLMESLPQPDSWTIRILATDLSGEMLERTKAGRYSQLEVNRGLPAPMLVKYFQKHGTEWQVVEKLRRMVEVRPLNLIEPWAGMPQCDIVFLRNVLIYFDVPTKRLILGKVKKVLRPDGFLFLGGAETTINVDEAWSRVQFGRGVCYKPQA
jgi:chemotaxis protein methyltransferase CheR